MTKKTVAIAAAMGLAALPAFAGMTAPDAQMHFKAVASADLSAIMSQYKPDATLYWMGGPLDGAYKGTDQIKGVWSKFVKAMGATSATVKDVKVAGAGMGMTVTADVTFHGKTSVPVRYVLVYAGKKIVDEVWQVEGKMGSM